MKKPSLMTGARNEYSGVQERIYDLRDGNGAELGGVVSVRYWDSYTPNKRRPTLVVDLRNLTENVVLLLDGRPVVMDHRVNYEDDPVG